MGNKIGIILEGGAMRSIFTAGVVDCLMDNNIDIPEVIAVSAGAYAGMNYVSGQRGRVLEAVLKPMETRKIYGLKVLLRTGDFFDMDLLFDKIPKEDAPFDFEAFKNSDKHFITSTISCKTGEPHYYDSFKDIDEFLHICRVANSLPMLARVGYIDGEAMMDGGMADAIPVEKALEDGWDKIIVVFTREKSYRKGPKGDIYNSRLVKFFYRKHKGLLKSIMRRPKRYNDSIETLNRMEEEGKAFVFRPEGIKLTNREKDTNVLREYYKVGYDYAASRMDELKAFLNN